MMLKFTSSLLLFYTILQVAVAQEKDLNFYYSEGIAAYKKNDFSTFLENFEQAYKIRHDHPTIMYNLAAAYALNHQENKSLALLNELITFRADSSILSDPDFEILHQTQDFTDLTNKIAHQNTLINLTKEVTTVQGKYHPEGIAYDAKKNTFYISSIRKGLILKVDRNGEVSTFYNANKNTWSVSGLAIDKKRNRLWACTVATPNFENYKKEDEGKSAILCFNLANGDLLKRYDIQDENQHWFGDLTINKLGKVYITDSSFPAIYQTEFEADSLQLLAQYPELKSLQGIALSSNEKSLYFVDYVKGILKVDIAKPELTYLVKHHMHPYHLKGIDGLYFYKNTLVAIQNGVKPIRVCQFQINKAGTEIVNTQLLVNADPKFNEPTLGTISKSKFYFIANSPWGLYNKDFALPEDDKIPETMIVETLLNKK
ncbi:SMP-30/gluconolactonase/LRE family protein [Chondrinema litorale]|uniref:SMP-30/gluconolactonase/LRE family protein n=1 Tax=Chondrinema litorale TaxID=2994555 RepID=UPI002542F503|nr:SMP-30/gluconolactonase/LRE family protein [Chondrinema litorale]UZR94213.1 SMP-30/gluconolactonase/LRE family protein [Chondrinema litorale]